MSRRRQQSQTQPSSNDSSSSSRIELLEHRLLMSKSSGNLNLDVTLCPCPTCTGAGGEEMHAAALKKIADVSINPVHIHKGPPNSSNDPGNLSGFVWLDRNADGVIDDDEGGLFNQTVFLDENNNGDLDDGETSTVTNPAGYYVFKDLEAGEYTIRQANLWSEFRVSEPGNERIRVTLDGGDDSVTNLNFGNFLPNPVVVDYMVAYTPNARAGAGGNDRILEQITDMISSTNSAFANSQVNVQLNLIATHRVDYRDNGSGVRDREYLRRKGDSFLSEIHALRNEVGADMVTLLIEGAFDLGGISIFPDRDLIDPSTTGFNIVTREGATSLMVFAHELGHNFGAGHDIETDTGGAFRFSKGWHMQVGRNLYNTIMAYPIDGDFSGNSIEQVLPVFSNPDLSYKGVPMGQEPESGDARGADNARTIRRFAALIANFRDRDQAGSTRRSALNLGTFPEGREGVVRDAVGNADQFDVYKFTIEDPTHLTARAFRFSHNAELQLLQGNRVIENSRRPGDRNERIEADLDPGTYFVRVYHGGGKRGTSYTLKLIADEAEGAQSSAFRAAQATAAATSRSLFSRDKDRDADDEETSIVDLV